SVGAESSRQEFRLLGHHQVGGAQLDGGAYGHGAAGPAARGGSGDLLCNGSLRGLSVRGGAAVAHLTRSAGRSHPGRSPVRRRDRLLEAALVPLGPWDGFYQKNRQKDAEIANVESPTPDSGTSKTCYHFDRHIPR